MGDKGGKKDKNKNKQTAVDEAEARGAKEARQRPGQDLHSQEARKAIVGAANGRSD